MYNVITKTLFLFLLVLVPQLGFSGEQVTTPRTGELTLNQISQPDGSGFMTRSGRDPYIIFPPLQVSHYDIRGIEMEIVFNPMPVQPFLMELFWRPDFEGFSEQRKVFFALLPAKTGNSLKFIIPLKNQAGYKQFRLDFPRNFQSSFKIKTFRPLTAEILTEDVEHVEAFYKLTVAETLTPGIIIPYLAHTIRHGLSRLPKDMPFLIVWFLLILAVLFGTRTVSRSIRKQQEASQENGSGK